MAQTFASRTDRVRFGGVNPIFPVSDLVASVAYYETALGFEVHWQEPGVIASVQRDRCEIFLVEGDQGSAPTWLWVGVDDAGALYEEYLASDAKVRQPPTNFPWAFEMQIEDLDGNVIRLGSDPIEGQPFGPWLDMRGRAWAMYDDASETVEC